MKKILSVIAIMMMVVMKSWASVDPVQPSKGSGSVDSPFEIASAGNLVWFANKVNAGQTVLCGKLTADIYLVDDQTMIGTSSNPFAGTFDGDGHTVTVNYTMEDSYVALFRYVKNATITQLATSGSITNAYYAGGIVSHCESSTITRCASNVTIDAGLKSDATLDLLATYGGIVAYMLSDTNLSDCVFYGKFVYSNSENTFCLNTGGIEYAGEENQKVSNCLFVNNSTCEYENSNTFISGTDAVAVNCYYTKLINEGDDGTRVTDADLKSGKACYLLNQKISDGTQLWYQVIGTEDCPMPFTKSGGTVYGGVDVCPNSQRDDTYSNTTHNLTTGSSISNGVGRTPCQNTGCVGKDEQYLTPTLDNGYYKIENAGNLIWFANRVNAGYTSIKGKLTKDVNLEDYQAMIGTSSHPFAGEFDGDGNTVKVNYNTNSDYAALFRYTRGASIYKISTSGSIATSAKYAAGVIGHSENTKISRCCSSVDIASSVKGDGSHGGIVANVVSGDDVSDCLFTGTFSGSETTNCGGIVGLASNALTVSNCVYINNGASCTDGACTIARGDNVTIEDCFYTVAFGTEQGTQVSTDVMGSGEICYKLNKGASYGERHWNQIIGKDSNPTPLPENGGTVYAGDDLCSSTSGYANKTHTVKSYTDGVGMCSVCYKTVNMAPSYNATSSTYDIANKGNLNWFAGIVNAGETKVNGKLSKDISLGSSQTMIGTSDYPYEGEFDGDGHTVTVNYKAEKGYVALFQYTKGATISNLSTTGNIAMSFARAAGIVAHSEDTNVKRCASDVNITTSEYYNNNYNGGIVNEASGTCSVSDCLFNGTISRSSEDATVFFSGIAGKVLGNLTVSDCLVCGRNENEFGNGTSYSIASWMDGTNVTIDNSYYYYESESAASFSNKEGELVTSEQLTSGEVCYNLNKQVSDGTQAWYQVMSTESNPKPFAEENGTVYSGVDACPYGTSTYTNQTHIYTSTVDEQTGVITYTCSNEGCTYSYTDGTKPEYDTATKTYMIRSQENLAWFADNVNSGVCNTANAKLLADVTMPLEKIIANSENYAYSGKFDGNHHTVTVEYDSNTWSANSELDGLGLFGYTNGATISDLTTTGSINDIVDGRKHDGGIVSNARNTVIERCTSSVSLYHNMYYPYGENVEYDSDAKEFGGIVGYADICSKIDNCSFTGALTMLTTDNWAMIAGYADGATISNCFASSSLSVISATGDYKSMDRYTIAGGNGNITNCYYKDALGIAQGTQKTETEFSNGNLCDLLNSGVSDGTQAWYQTLDSDDIPVLDSTHGTLYSGDNACPSTKTYSNQTHNFEKVVNSDGYYRATCANTDCQGVHKYEQPECVADVYQIANKGNLCWISEQVASGSTDMSCVLLNDIDMNDVTEWNPIGVDDDAAFSGTFDGQGYRIKNLTVKDKDASLGLFGCVAGMNTVIKNVIIDSSCSVTSFAGSGVAGLVGSVSSASGSTCNVTIENCGNEADITGVMNVAGILGGVYNNDNTNITIVNSYNTGNINGLSTSATLCGYAGNNYTFANCYNSGSITGLNESNPFYNGGTGVCSVSNCYDVNSGNVTEITADDVCYGKLCSLLNSNGSTVYTQDIENDDHPVPGAAGLHYTRTMTNQWGTICLPFAAEAGEDYDFYVLDNVTADVLSLTKVSALDAGTPAIVRRNTSASGIDIPGSGSAFVTAPVAGSSANGLTVTGVFTPTDITSEDGYIIANDAFWNIADVKGENKVYCAPFRAYLAGSITSDAKRLNIGLTEDTPTELDAIISPLGDLNGDIFDVNGNRLDELQPGVNIVKFNNGTTKKVIVK